MQEFILQLMNQFGYLGVFLLILLENVFPPIPSEVILTFGGFMTTYSDMSVWIVILAATLGSVAGAVVLYLVGRLLTKARLERLIASRVGRLLHLENRDVKRAGGWFTRHGNAAIFFCRFIPIVRSLISIPAGMTKTRIAPFLAFTVAGTFLWNTVLVLLGRAAGSAWVKIAEYTDIYTMVAIGVLAIAVAVVGALFIKRRFLHK